MKILAHLHRFIPSPLVCGAIFASLAAVVPAYAQTSAGFTVPGTASIYLAGQPDGTGTFYAEYAPANSPVQVTGLMLTAGTTLTFEAAGTTNGTGASTPVIARFRQMPASAGPLTPRTA